MDGFGNMFGSYKQAKDLAMSPNQVETVLVAVGANYKVGGFDGPGDPLLALGQGRGWLSPTGSLYRFTGYSANIMGPTFALVTQVVGAIYVIEYIGAAGTIGWAAASAIAQHFGIDLDADDNKGIHYHETKATALDPEILKETLLEVLPPGIRIGVKKAVEELKSNRKAGAESAMNVIAGSVPGANAVLWLIGALGQLTGVTDADPSFVLRDEDKRALAVSLNIPIEVVERVIDAAEDALTSNDEDDDE